MYLYFFSFVCIFYVGLAELHLSPNQPPNEVVIKQILETREKICDEQVRQWEKHATFISWLKLNFWLEKLGLLF